MTWTTFKRLTIKINIALVLGGWLTFWGYGFVVRDVPPLSVVPGLLLLSGLALPVISFLCFLGAHLYLLAQAIRTGVVARLSNLSTWAIAIMCFAIILSALAGTVSLDVFELTVAVTGPIGVLAFIFLVFGDLGAEIRKWRFK